MAEYRKPTWFEGVRSWDARSDKPLPDELTALVRDATAEAVGFGLTPSAPYKIEIRPAAPEKGEAPGTIVEVILECEDVPEPTPKQLGAFTVGEVVGEVATMTPDACAAAGGHVFTRADSDRMRTFEHEGATCLNCGTPVLARDLAAAAGLGWTDGAWRPHG